MAQVKASRQSKQGWIVRDPDVWGGEPTIRGTRVPVSSVVIEWQVSGGDEEQLRRAFPRVEAAAIREAVVYYQAHRDEIDRLVEENERAASALD